MNRRGMIDGILKMAGRANSFQEIRIVKKGDPVSDDPNIIYILKSARNFH